MNTTTCSFMPAPLQHSAAGSNDAEFGRTKLAPNSSTRFRTAIITGGNSGLGYACAGALLTEGSSGQPWNVVIACRDMTRACEAVERLRKQAAAAGTAGQVEAMHLNFGSLHSIRDFAKELTQRLEDRNLPPVHALICNAGVQKGGVQTLTVDGFESTFGVNHLGHFLLVNLLTPLLSAPARIAVVASGVHDPAQKTGMPAPAWNDPVALARGELGSLGASDSATKANRRRYATSKLANVFFTYELARRLPEGITVSAFDPGLMPGTGLVREAPAALQWLWHLVLPRVMPLLRRVVSPNIHSPAESGAALARLASDYSLGNRAGNYFEGMREIRSSTESYDIAHAAELWQASIELTGLQPVTPPLQLAPPRNSLTSQPPPPKADTNMNTNRQKLSGKVAVVTGASKGIGAAIATHLAAAGASVVVNYSTSKEGADRVVDLIAKRGGTAIAVQANVALQPDIDRLFAATETAFGRVDILVNNAGVYEFAPLENVTEEHFHRQFDLNVLGLLLSSQKAVASFGDEGGSIINISSAAAVTPQPNGSVYSATKAAVDAITVSLARELGARKIRVNSLNPGLVETEGTHTAGFMANEFHATAIAQTPLGRIGQPDDVGPVAVFLASEDARWITGETLLVSGGFR